MPDPLRELIEGVAQATAELIAEERPSDLWAERHRIARAIADATEAEAQEDPWAPWRIVRDRLGGCGMKAIRERHLIADLATAPERETR